MRTRVARCAPVPSWRQRPAGPDLGTARKRGALELAASEETLNEDLQARRRGHIPAGHLRVSIWAMSPDPGETTHAVRGMLPCSADSRSGSGSTGESPVRSLPAGCRRRSARSRGYKSTRIHDRRSRRYQPLQWLRMHRAWAAAAGGPNSRRTDDAKTVSGSFMGSSTDPVNESKSTCRAQRNSIRECTYLRQW